MHAPASTAAATTAAATTFDRTTALVPTGEEHRWSVELDAAWSSLRGVHGGYLAAVAVRAFELAHGDRPVRTTHVSFLRAGRVGPAEVVLSTVRRGSSSAVATVRVVQGGADVLTATVTGLVARARAGVGVGDQGDHGEDGVTAWRTPLEDPPAAASGCIPMAVPPAVRHFDHARALIDPADVPFAGGPRARIAGHVTPTEPRKVDAAWLVMLLDWFPPSPFSRHQVPLGGVSVDYAVHVHAVPHHLPPDGWLTAVIEARQGVDGLALEHGRLADPAGLVVAESFHTRLLSVAGPVDVASTLR